MKTHRFFSVFLLLILAVSLLTGPASAAEVPDPAIQAKAALLVDANTGRMVYGKNEHEELYPASLTKIMTALLTLEAVDSGQLSMDQPITVTESALEGLAADGSTAGIRAGEVLTVEQLLECMLIVSANEACNILAEQVSGSVDAFVGAMNEKAAALGCENTHFVNTTGLHDSQHYTSAWDLYLITAEALKHDDFLRICDMKSATIPATNLSEERVLHSTNYLISNWRALGYLDSRAHGVKTGSTSDAGHCLVSTAAEGSLSFISVVLGAESVTLPSGGTQVQSFSETSRLFDWGFENFSYQTVLEEAELVKEVSVALSKVDHVSVHPAADVLIPLSGGYLQAVSAKTFETLWYSDAFTKQNLSSLTVDGDYVYINTLDYWSGNGNDVQNGTVRRINIHTGAIAGSASVADGGYYWSGGLMVNGYYVVGGDYGQVRVYSADLSKLVGSIKLSGGNIRSALTVHDGYIYAVTRDDGTLHKLTIGSDGSITEAAKVQFAAYSTSTPVFSGKYAFIGGTTVNNWKAKAKAKAKAKGLLSIIDLSDMSVKQITKADGEELGFESKGTPLVSTHDGETYVYFTLNGAKGNWPNYTTGGGVYMYKLGDAEATEVFVPGSGYANYCMASVVCDQFGNL